MNDENINTKSESYTKLLKLGSEFFLRSICYIDRSGHLSRDVINMDCPFSIGTI